VNKGSGFFAFSLLGLIGFVLVLVGAQGPWLEFPLSSAVYAGNIPSPWPFHALDSLKALLILLGLFAGLGWLVGLRLVTLCVVVLGVAVITGFFYTWFVEPSWLASYLSESEQRIALQEFLSHYYWPNKNPEPTTTLQSDFEYLSDYLKVFWYTTGWGWTAFSTGLLLLLLDNYFSTVRMSAISLVTSVILGLFVVSMFYPLFQAEHYHRRGDELLGTGQPSEAISAYETALRLNPVLRFSGPFLNKASRAFYQSEGETSQFAVLYRASNRDQWITGKPLSDSARERLQTSSRLLREVMKVAHQGSLLQSAIMDRSGNEYTRILNMQGLDAHVTEHPAVSLALFQRSLSYDRTQLHTGFFLAHVQNALGLMDDAIATLEEMLDLVAHKAVRADLLCTIGDADSLGQRPFAAREAYLKCLDSDSLYNYRAVFNLGGT
jgi:tetratricopeptide (TPR) repeat protein